MLSESEYKIVGGPHILFRVPVEQSELIEVSKTYVQAINDDVELRDNLLAAQKRLFQDNTYTLDYEQSGLRKLFDQVDLQYQQNTQIIQSASGMEIEIYRMIPPYVDSSEIIDEE